ncbi:MAG: hypothetical protein ACQESC_04900 [Nanobdellota archaeon]
MVKKTSLLIPILTLAGAVSSVAQTDSDSKAVSFDNFKEGLSEQYSFSTGVHLRNVPDKSIYQEGQAIGNVSIGIPLVQSKEDGSIYSVAIDGYIDPKGRTALLSSESDQRRVIQDGEHTIQYLDVKEDLNISRQLAGVSLENKRSLFNTFNSTYFRLGTGVSLDQKLTETKNVKYVREGEDSMHAYTLDAERGDSQYGVSWSGFSAGIGLEFDKDVRFGVEVNGMLGKDLTVGVELGYTFGLSSDDSAYTFD